MSQQDDSGSGTLRYFGAQTKPLRGRAAVSAGELGGMVGYSESAIASFEQGRRVPKRHLVEQFDTILDARGLLTAGTRTGTRD